MMMMLKNSTASQPSSKFKEKFTSQSWQMDPEYILVDWLTETLGRWMLYLQWVGPGRFDHIQVWVTAVHIGLQAAAGIKDAVCIWWDRFQTGVYDAVPLFLWQGKDHKSSVSIIA